MGKRRGGREFVFCARKKKRKVGAYGRHTDGAQFNSCFYSVSLQSHFVVKYIKLCISDVGEVPGELVQAGEQLASRSRQRSASSPAANSRESSTDGPGRSVCVMTGRARASVV